MCKSVSLLTGIYSLFKFILITDIFGLLCTILVCTLCFSISIYCFNFKLSFNSHLILSSRKEVMHSNYHRNMKMYT